MNMYTKGLMILLLMAAVPVIGAESDWPCFRGPEYNSISPETDWEPLKSTNDLDITWEKNIGDGYSCVTIVGSNLYAMGNTHATSTVWCLKAATGNVVWQYSYASLPGIFKGPQATPVWDDGRLYIVGKNGDIFCFEADNGTLLWQKNMIKLYGVEACKFGLGSSVRVLEDLVLINENLYGMALNKKTGGMVWTSPTGIGGYSSPMIISSNGKRHCLFFGLDALYGVEPATGEKVWQFAWPSKFRVNAADPIIIDDSVFISSGYGKGCALVQIKDGSVTQLWANTEMKNQFSTSILLDGYIYGCDGDSGKGDLVCMDAKTGVEQWRRKTGFFSPLAANNILILLTEKGELIFVAAAPGAYKELGRSEVFNNTTERCWTMPVLCSGNLYCRNSSGRLVSINLKI